MKKILYLLLLIPSLVFGQVKPFKTDTLKVNYIKSLAAAAKVYVNDTLVLKDGQKQTSAFTETLKSNYNSSYNLSHTHLNSGVLAGIKASDTTRWAQGGSGTMTSSQIIDSISNKRVLPVTKKISFTKLNGQIFPYQLTTTTYLDVDTVGSISGASNIYQILGLSGSVLNHANRFSPVDTNYTNRSINTTTGKLYTWLAGCFGSGNYRIFKFNLIDSTTAPGAPIQLAALGSPQATGISQTQINLTWTTDNLGRYIELDSASTLGGTYVNISSTIDKRATTYNVTGLHNNHQTFFRLRKISNGVDTLSSAYVNVNATTSSLTTLSTPTNGTATANSSTQITATVSNVDANASYVSLDYKLNSSGTWTNYSATLPRTTTSQAIGSLTAGSLYNTRWTAIGDGITYSNSAASSTQSATTWGTAPTVSSAYTSTTGDTVHIVFSKAMQASPSATGLTFSPSKTISSITRHATNSAMYDIVVSVAFASGDAITCSYTPGTITAEDLGVLAGFTGQSVTNNVTASFDSDAQAYFTATGTADNTFKNAWNTFVVAAKDNSGGNAYYSAFQALYFLCHNDQAMNKFNAINPVNTDGGFRMTFTGSWTVAANGITGGAGISGDTHYIPSVNGSLNNQSIGYYTGSDTDEDSYVIGCGTSNNTLGLKARTGSAQPRFVNMSTGSSGIPGLNTGISSGAGWNMSSRGDGTTQYNYVEHTSGNEPYISNHYNSVSATSTSLPTVSVKIGAVGSGVYYAAQAYCTMQYRMCWVGTNFTTGQALKFRTDVNNLMTTMGLNQ